MLNLSKLKFNNQIKQYAVNNFSTNHLHKMGGYTRTYILLIVKYHIKLTNTSQNMQTIHKIFNIITLKIIIAQIITIHIH